MIRALVLLWTLLALLVAPAFAQLAQPLRLTGFGAEGGDFRAAVSDGRILRGTDLDGAELNMTEGGIPFGLRIEAAGPDQGDSLPMSGCFT